MKPCQVSADYWIARVIPSTAVGLPTFFWLHVKKKKLFIKAVFPYKRHVSVWSCNHPLWCLAWCSRGLLTHFVSRLTFGFLAWGPVLSSLSLHLEAPRWGAKEWSLSGVQHKRLVLTSRTVLWKTATSLSSPGLPPFCPYDLLGHRGPQKRSNLLLRLIYLKVMESLEYLFFPFWRSFKMKNLLPFSKDTCNIWLSKV